MSHSLLIYSTSKKISTQKKRERYYREIVNGMGLCISDFYTYRYLPFQMPSFTWYLVLFIYIDPVRKQFYNGLPYSF